MPTLGHILCVDDEEDILQVAKLSLEAVGGFQVSLCRGSGEAVARAESLRPDLILLDVMMPEMDGPATLLKLRENPVTSPVPVAFMTAKAQPAEIRRYLGLGAIGVISKPFDPMTLSAEIRALWEKQREAP
ncbi:MAG TPA: response regulator [Fibrobacteria bacterium]|nr:response regulator [Fibrobacteria bacterium]